MKRNNKIEKNFRVCPDNNEDCQYFDKKYQKCRLYLDKKIEPWSGPCISYKYLLDEEYTPDENIEYDDEM